MCRGHDFLIFANNTRSKQNKKSVGARQSSKVFRQYTWFLENNTALSNFIYGILH